jgi:ADP-heptose:LPS heptosyltransferase
MWNEVRNGKIIVNINTSNLLPARKYDRESFATVISGLLEKRKDAVVLLTGTADEREFVQKLSIQFNNRSVINVAGEWTLAQFMEELSDCELFITGDSAPLHLAVSMNVATLALWGPTQPGHFGYLDAPCLRSVSLNMACAPCFLHPHSRPAQSCKGTITCMRNLTPALVETAAREMIATLPSTREITYPLKCVPADANAFA